MDVQDIKTYFILFKPLFLVLSVNFGFFRFIIGQQIQLSDRISKIEGTCQEREKTIYKEEKTNQAEESENSSSVND